MRDRDRSHPGRGEILVRVPAATVNRTDCAYRSGTPRINRAFCGWPRLRGHVLGSSLVATSPSRQPTIVGVWFACGTWAGIQRPGGRLGGYTLRATATDWTVGAGR